MDLNVKIPPSTIFRLLQKITVDCKDDGQSFQINDRIYAIKDGLKDSAYTLLAEHELFLLYGRQSLLPEKPIVLISSHIDCVYSKCFCSEAKDCYHGTFDNSFTNAALLYVMKYHPLPFNVFIAFTGDEEHNSGGAVALTVYLTQHQNPIRFALVLDVTNEGWYEQHLVALENDLGIDLLTAHRIIETMKPYTGRYAYVHDAAPDETWDYNEYGIPSLTLSAPVCGDMHDDSGVDVRKETFPFYCNVLNDLANEIANLK